MEDQNVSGKTRTLLLISGFVALTLGSFIWFIATWDPAVEDSVVSIADRPTKGTMT